MSSPTANPPQGAAPEGTNEQISPKPPAESSQAPQGQKQEDQSEGKVTISTREYAELQRAKARTLSFEKRKQFLAKQQASNESGDPVSVELAKAEDRVREAEQRAMRAEVGSKVRDILDKEEFKALPRSTRELILKNPALLSTADNVEEALLDIEDFVREQVAGEAAQHQSGQGENKNEPTGHQIPPVVNKGTPAPTNSGVFENIEGLQGTALSRAVLRNKIRQVKKL